MLQLNLMKVFMKYDEIVKYRKYFIKLFFKEHDHRPHTVIDQLYNYKGGIVPNATESEKPSTVKEV